MRIDQVLSSGRPTISFEFFPPKNEQGVNLLYGAIEDLRRLRPTETEQGFNLLYQAIEDLRPLRPSYVSVTYGAGGSTRSKTVELVEKIQNEIGIRSMAHLTCVGHTADEIGSILDDLWRAGIVNVLALRGDPPAGQTVFTKTEGGFGNADELVRFVRARHDFCIGVAGYPEGHPQCLNKTRDLEYLKRKVDNGGNFVVTQLFFDNADFYRFRDDARAMGINVPIVAGIMPITNVGQIKRFVSMCGARIPHRPLTKRESIEGPRPDAVHQTGSDYAGKPCRGLIWTEVDTTDLYHL